MPSPPSLAVPAAGAPLAAPASPEAPRADVQRLIEELTGRAPPATRNAAEWETAYGLVVDALISARDYPMPGRKPTPALVLLDQLVRRALNPEKAVQQAALVRVLLARLEKSRDLNQRVFCLRQLAVLGTEEPVGVLARLLADPDSTIRQYALGALESNPSPAAGRALAAALSDSRDPSWRVAIIHALGRRRQTSAERVLSELAADRHPSVAAAAVLALANLGAAAGPLPGEHKPPGQELSDALIHGKLLRAERLLEQGELRAARKLYLQVFQTAQAAHLRCGALSGVVRCGPAEALPHVLEALEGSDAVLQAHAARLAGTIPGREAAARFRAALPRLPAQAQQWLSEALSASP